MHHQRTDIKRLIVKGEINRKGFIQLKLTSKTTTTGLNKYFVTTTAWMLQLVKHTRKAKDKIFN